MMRRIREDDPPRPSTKLSTIGAAASDVVHKRRTETRALHKSLRSDLDWVVLRALEKDPARRYGTASALGDDLRRFLAHEPLEAGPPSASYRLRKLARKHRAALTAASLVFVTLIAGVIGTVSYAIESGKHAAEAQRNLAQFDLLANVVHLETARERMSELTPAWPETEPRMLEWLDEFAEPLRAALPEARRAVDELRERLDLGSGTQDADLLARLRARLGAMVAAQRRRDGQDTSAIGAFLRGVDQRTGASRARVALDLTGRRRARLREGTRRDVPRVVSDQSGRGRARSGDRSHP